MVSAETQWGNRLLETTLNNFTRTGMLHAVAYTALCTHYCEGMLYTHPFSLRFTCYADFTPLYCLTDMDATEYYKTQLQSI